MMLKATKRAEKKDVINTMPDIEETVAEKTSRLARELEGKNIAFYSVLLNAWIETRMEKDRTLVMLSSASIGLLVTLLSTVGVNDDWELLFFIIAFLAFMVTISSSLIIYQLNSNHLKKALLGSSENELKLKILDIVSISSFLLGGLLFLVIGVIAAKNQLIISEEIVMTKEYKDSPMTGKDGLNESLIGVRDLNPNERRSLDGIEDLNPASGGQSESQGSESDAQSGGSESGSDSEGK